MKKNVANEFHNITQYFTPKVIGEVNDQYVKLALIKGEDIPWHNHANEDELFYILEGKLLMEIENQDSFYLKQGDMYIVPMGVNHRVSSEEECRIMLIETKTTQHTGEVKSAVTRSITEQIY